MDPLSITATAGQLASNAISLVQFIRSFHAGSQGLPQKLDDLNAQLGAFAGTVDSIQKFLDDKLASHGEKSVVYVSTAKNTSSCVSMLLTTWGPPDFLWIAVLAFGQLEVVGCAGRAH